MSPQVTISLKQSPAKPHLNVHEWDDKWNLVQVEGCVHAGIGVCARRWRGLCTQAEGCVHACVGV